MKWVTVLDCKSRFIDSIACFGLKGNSNMHKMAFMLEKEYIIVFFCIVCVLTVLVIYKIIANTVFAEKTVE